MLTNLSIVLPIFALILAGWIARKTGALSENATREVNRLVVYLACPRCSSISWPMPNPPRSGSRAS